MNNEPCKDCGGEGGYWDQDPYNRMLLEYVYCDCPAGTAKRYDEMRPEDFHLYPPVKTP